MKAQKNIAKLRQWVRKSQTEETEDLDASETAVLEVTDVMSYKVRQAVVNRTQTESGQTYDTTTYITL